MTYNKYIFWSLVIAIICAPLEQARADFFYDDNREFTYEGYVFTGSAAVAIIAGSYATYRYLYPPKENVDSTQELSSKYTTIDSAALISVALAAQAMAIMTINCGVEEQIRRPIRENKIKELADCLLEQELLDQKTELEWKDNNNLLAFSILTEQQKNELLEIKLRHIKKSHSFDFRVIARITNDYSYDNLLMLIKTAQMLAKQQGNELLDMSHFNMAFNHSHIGKQCKICIVDDMLSRKIAQHEAGHAFTVISKDTKHILHQISIEPRYYKSSDRDLYLGFYKPNRIHEEQTSWTESDYENVIMRMLAGGISEQIADLPYALKEEDYEHGSLHDFLSRQTIQGDLQQAYGIAYEIMRLEHIRNGVTHWPEQAITNQRRDKIIAEAYNKTYKFIKENKEQVKKIADELVVKKTMSGDEVYELVGKRRPKYDFEEENIHNKE